MNGRAQHWWTIPAIILVGVVFYAGLFWAVLTWYRWVKRSAHVRSQRAFEGLKVHNGPAPGLVAVVFHTYGGFLLFVSQTEHRFWAPPDDAREALRRLHRINLRWGVFARGGFLIPPLSYGNYLGQMRAIRRQESALFD